MDKKDNIFPEVISVTPQSIAEIAGIRRGDKIISINGEHLKDFIDYKFLIAENCIDVKVRRGEKHITFNIEKDYDTDIGINFESTVFDGMRLCNNKCIFCFIDQLPKGMRKSLYVKDDDYRLSVIFGNFVTLTNVTINDMKRIKQWHLGPLYISVHSTDPDVRELMLNNNKARKIKYQLKSLAEAGIVIHTQIVLCPGINDGNVLEKSIEDLVGLWPSVQSVGIVPVGITNSRDKLFPLKAVNKNDAVGIIKQVDKWQVQFVEKLGYPFVFLADEFYNIAMKEVPCEQYYGGYPQLENGIGITRQFLTELEKVKLPKALSKNIKLTIITGKSGHTYLKRLQQKFSIVKGLSIDVLVVENTSFGNTITVSGLIGGYDIVKAVGKKTLDGFVIIPDVMLRDGENIFLDNVSVPELKDHLECEVIPVSGPLMLGEKIIEWGR